MDAFIEICGKHRVGDCEQQLIAGFSQPVIMFLVMAERSSLQRKQPGLRANNPDPIMLSAGDKKSAECDLCAKACKSSSSSPMPWRMESGTPTKGLEQVKAQFFAIVDGMDSLRKLLGIERFADIPKTRHNVAVIAHHLFAEQSINRLFDTVINVEEVVGALWNTL